VKQKSQMRGWVLCLYLAYGLGYAVYEANYRPKLSSELTLAAKSKNKKRKVENNGKFQTCVLGVVE
jgi:hypothetical protein